MYRQQHFGLPVEIEAEWKQLLVAVEPSIERGINLGISRLKDAFQEYENSREEWFLLKKHKLEELLEAEKNKQLSDRLLQIINNRFVYGCSMFWPIA